MLCAVMSLFIPKVMKSYSTYLVEITVQRLFHVLKQALSCFPIMGNKTNAGSILIPSRFEQPAEQGGQTLLLIR